ncbi:MAG: DUF423 domain-containing protein [Crocinitomicaceae bacterium]
MKQKTIFLWAIFFIATAIILGAFGAHALKKVLTPESLQSFETGVRYQMYQGLGLLLIGSFADKWNFSLKWPVRLLIFGTLFFSVSIYGLSMQAPMDISLKFLGPITPIGGLLMITGWCLLGIKIWKEA